jgi:hypothetical protein
MRMMQQRRERIGFRLCGVMMMVSLMGFGAFAAPARAQNAADAPAIPAPPGLVSAEMKPGVLDKAAAMYGDPQSILRAGYFTPQELSRIDARQPVVMDRYVMILQAVNSNLRYIGEATFQYIAKTQRAPQFNQSMANQVNASSKASGSNMNLSLHNEQVVIDEPDCIAKIVSSQYSQGARTLNLDLLSAYVRVDGQLVLIHAAARSDVAADKAWLQDKVVPWVRSLPTAHR